MSTFSKKIKKSHKPLPISKSRSPDLSQVDISGYLQPFTNFPHLPKCVQLAVSEGPPLKLEAIYAMKIPQNQFKFSQKLEKMKVLGAAQDQVLERWLQDKCKVRKSSADMQQYFCYENAKAQLKALFEDFFNSQGLTCGKEEIIQEEEGKIWYFWGF